MDKFYQKTKKIVRWVLATRFRRIMASLLVIILIIGPLSFLLFNKKTQAAWFDENWYYRKSIPLTNNTTAENNVYMAVTLDTSDTAKFQTDCGDLRFTKYNGEIMPYYIASGCGTASTVVYAGFDMFPAGQQTIYYYYGNPSADNGFTNASGSGSVTQANMRVSVVNGTAFTDFSSAGTITENLGKKLVISDSASKKLTGYIKAAGAGETYGAEDASNSSLDNLTGVYTNGPGGGTPTLSTETTGCHTSNCLRATIASGQTYGGWQVITNNAPNGSLYKYSSWAKQDTASGIDMHTAYSSGAEPGQTTGWVYPSSWTQYTLYQTTNNSGQWNKLNWYIHDAAGESALFDDASTKQVLTPSATGATITSTANGGTYNWANEESGFNRNDSSNYTYIVYPQAFSTVASNYTVGSLGSEEKSTAPVGYWKFDEGYGITAHDETSNRNDGTLGASTAAPTWKPESECLGGKCLAFDGTDDYVSLPNEIVPVSSIRSGGITYSAWIKTNNNAIEQRIVGQKQSSGYSDYSSGGIGISASGYARTMAYDDNIAYKYSDSATVLQKNTWYFISGTYDPSDQKIRVYVNGKLEGAPTAITTFSRLVANNDNRVGISTHASTPYPFKGNIDEAKVYPYARTAAQIRQDYNAGLSGMGTSSGSSVAIGGKSDKWLTDGLVGHWKMDEASWNGTSGEVIDASGNGNNGTSVSGAATASGKFGNGGSFDGTDDYVDVGSGSSLNLSGNFSVGAWIKTNNASNYRTIVSWGQHTTNLDRSLWLDSGTGKATLYFYPTSGNQILGTSDLRDNNWHFVMGTWDGTTGRIYVDGKLENSGSLTAGSFSYTGTKIGQNVSNNYRFIGSIDDARIYNRALSPGEVQKLYEWAPGPVGEWKMDEKVSGDAKTIADSSGNGNNGTTNDGANNVGMDCTKPGKFGSTCQFDGADDFVGSDTYSGWVNSAVTIEAWAKRSGNPASFTQVVGDKGTRGALYVNSSGNIFFQLSLTTAGNVTLNSQTMNNEWNHYAGVWENGGKLKFYKNGMLITESASSYNDTIPAFTGYWLGRYSSGDYFNGSVDDVRIYNYARTPKQILEDMNGGQEGTLEPIAYYKFDEGFSNVANNSGVGGSSLNGTLTPGAGGSNATATQMWDNGGKIGKAIEFDGTDDFVGMGDAMDMGTNDFSISTWVKSTSTSSGSNNGIVYKRGTGYYYSEGYRLNMPNGQFNFHIADGTNYQSLTVGNSSQYNDGNWHSVIATAERGKKMTIYVDGEYINEIAETTVANIDSSINFAVGALNTSGSTYYHPFLGQIDEVKIYNYALTDDDVKADFNRGSSTVLGSTGTNSTGAPDSSSSREYCVPGDATSCAGPVAEWKMDEKVSGDSKTLYDTSGSGNNGTTHYGANATGIDCAKTGKLGSACGFDGVDDYITANNQSFITKNGTYTFSAWIYQEGPGSGQTQTIFQNSLGSSDRNGMSIGADNIRFGFYNGSTWSGASGGISRNVWTHVEGVNNAGSLNLYINGVLQTGTNVPYMADTIDYLFIGKASISGDPHFWDPFKGRIDDIRIFNYARTPAQIAWDYNKGKPVAEWRFDECQGGTVHDESGNVNNGTINLGASGQTALGTCTDNANTPWYNGRTGKKNASLNFDGTDDYVSHTTQGISSRNGTVAGWVKPTQSSPWGFWQTHDSAGNNWVDWITMFSYDGGTFYFRMGNGSSCCSNDVTFSSSLIPINTWSHLAFTWEGTTMKAYINGIVVASKTNATLQSIVDSGARIGYGHDKKMSGQIDEVKIFNYALTEDQVRNVYNNSSAVYFGN